MKIEVWSDYVCPFCYIGKRRLENALQTTGLDAHANVSYKAYQLDPSTPVDSNKPMVDSLAQKYGVDMVQAKGMLENVAEQAKTVDLEYNINGMKEVNTFKAHRLAKLAEEEGLGEQATERLLHGYFVAGEAIGDDAVLLEVAKELGMNQDRVQEVLQSDEFTNDVNTDIAQAGQIGVQGVPFFVINRKYAISGAQPAEAFEEALRKVAEEEGIQPSLNILNTDDSGICTDGSCTP